MMTENSKEDRIVPVALGAAVLVTLAWNAILAVWLYDVATRLLG